MGDTNTAVIMKTVGAFYGVEKPVPILQLMSEEIRFFREIRTRLGFKWK
jgi:hypothetical protein